MKAEKKKDKEKETKKESLIIKKPTKLAADKDYGNKKTVMYRNRIPCQEIELPKRPNSLATKYPKLYKWDKM